METMPKPVELTTYIDAVERLGPNAHKYTLIALIGVISGKMYPNRRWVDEALCDAYEIAKRTIGKQYAYEEGDD